MPNETEKQYNELTKKFKLPNFKELDDELELSDMEETKFLLRVIMRRIAEKLDFYATFLGEILQPDSNLYVMHETRHFDETEKNKIYDVYRKLMEFHRLSIEISLNHDEKEEADYIASFCEEWEGIKKELLIYTRKIKDSWKEEVNIKEDVGYLG